MKTRKLFGVVFVIMYLISVLTGCAATPSTVYDTGVSNEDVYQDNSYWEKDNEIRLVFDIHIENEELQPEEFVSNSEGKKLPRSKEKVIRNLQKGIISFFQERYQIDVSEKIEKQEIAIFSSTGFMEGVMGYVDTNNPNILNLNERLLKDYSDEFETTYIHETLHQIGFRSENAYMIEEGITDALADMICCYIGIEPVLTIYYSESRTMAYQMLAADPEIVSCYLNDNEFDIIKRINEKLEGVPQPFIKSGNLGKRLESRLDVLHAIATGNAFGGTTNVLWIAFEAQEIMRAYCQECNPDANTIAYIRSHYLVVDYEAISIFEDDVGYGYNIE